MSKSSSGLWEHMRTLSSLRKKPSIKTFAQAKEYLGNRSRVKIGNETYLEKYSGSDQVISIRYVNTDIIIYYNNGMIRLDTGGYYSNSNKKRFNIFTPFNIESKNNQWYVFTNDGVFRFERVITFTEDGVCTDPTSYKVAHARSSSQGLR
jgi:hypothetical protein